MYIQYIHVHVHVSERCICRKKEERSKQCQTNNKAKQHSTPKAVTYPNKNELPRLGLEPTTLYTLDRVSAAHVHHVMCMNSTNTLYKYALILWELPPQHNTHNIRHLGYRIYVHVQYKPESVYIYTSTILYMYMYIPPWVWVSSSALW